MQVRRLERLGLAVGTAAGAALTPGTISGDSGRMLVIFLGLFSASILPTVSLLVNGMTASGRSVAAINKLEFELQAAMDALFLLFGCVAVSVGALIAMSVDPPTLLTRVPYLTTEILPRGGQSIVATAASAILIRAGQIPAILRRSLAMRHEIAVDEARRKLADKAPEAGAMRKAFATHPEFGKIVQLDDLQGREPH